MIIDASENSLVLSENSVGSIKQNKRTTKILIVDDEPFNLLACKYILKSAGL